MKLIDITENDAADLVAAITANIPAGESLGRILVAFPDYVLVEDRAREPALYGTEPGEAWRLVEVGDELAEVVTWRDGAEVARRMVRR